MGGSALKHLSVRRMQLQEYSALKEKVHHILADYYRLTAVPGTLHTKESFGDLDVLVSGAVGSCDPTLDPQFGSTGRVTSGNVTSFEVDRFQVDLIRVPEDSFDLARFYFCAEVGLLLGLLVAKGGLQLGFNGFYIRFVRHTGECVPFLLSTDPAHICEFLHIDMETPLGPGFASQQALFDYLQQCRFDLRLIKSGPDNHRQRRRMARPTSSAFLDLVESLPGTAAALNVEAVHLEAASAFGKAAAFETFKADFERAYRLRQVFNKQTVGSVVGLEGEELGRLRRAFQAAKGPQQILAMHDDATLERELLAFKDLWVKQALSTT